MIPERERATKDTVRDQMIADTFGELMDLHTEVSRLPGKLRDALAPTLAQLDGAPAHVANTLEAAQTAIAAFAAIEKIAVRKDVVYAIRSAQGRHVSWLAIALAVGIAGCALGTLATLAAHQYVFDEEAQETAEQAKYGRVLLAAWRTLDAETREKIRQAAAKLYSDTAALRGE